MKLTLLLALLSWIFPQPVQAKTKVSFPEAKIELKQEVKELYGPIQPPTPIKSTEPKKTNRPARVAKVDEGNKIQSNAGRRHYTKEEVKALIISYSEQYEINSAVPLCIAEKESGFNQYSKNKSSSASGVFQYLTSTWLSTDEGRAGLSVFDADANVRAAIKYMASRKSTKPWTVASKCPNL